MMDMRFNVDIEAQLQFEQNELAARAGIDAAHKYRQVAYDMPLLDYYLWI